MPQFAAQLNIIRTIRRLAKKAKNSFRRHHAGDNAVSEKIALQIQKNAYDLSRRQVKDTNTPVYLKIAEQLQAADDQIFRAAVYSLYNIAKNRQNRNEIISLLEKQQKNQRRSPEQLEYLAKKLSKL